MACACNKNRKTAAKIKYEAVYSSGAKPDSFDSVREAKTALARKGGGSVRAKQA